MSLVQWETVNATPGAGLQAVFKTTLTPSAQVRTFDLISIMLASAGVPATLRARTILAGSEVRLFPQATGLILPGSPTETIFPGREWAALELPRGIVAEDADRLVVVVNGFVAGEQNVNLVMAARYHQGQA